MYYIVLILSTVIQLCFAGITLLFTIFSSASIFNSNELSVTQELIFTIAIIVIPLSSIIIAPTLLYLSLKKSPKLSYWWHLFPVAMAAIYSLYILQFD